MTASLSYAYGIPSSSGRIRTAPEDFKVREELGFIPDGSGEHLWLYVRKQAANTDWVARRIAAFAGVSPRAVGYAGLKDRQAITEQWFSVHLPGKPDPDWSLCREPSFSVLNQQRHHRKLRRGTLAGNVFRIIIRDLQGVSGELQERINQIAVAGVPNYFGEQRFGHQGNNLNRAKDMFLGQTSSLDRHRRGLYLSAARAAIFNRVLSCRVAEGTWNQAVPGDVMMLDGSHSVFSVSVVDHEIQRRTAVQDIHPTGPLWGSGSLLSQNQVRTLEQNIANEYDVFRQGLERAGLQQERRTLRLRIMEIGFEVLDKTTVVLQFRLPSGGYATTVLRELIHVIRDV